MLCFNDPRSWKIVTPHLESTPSLTLLCPSHLVSFFFFGLCHLQFSAFIIFTHLFSSLLSFSPWECRFHERRCLVFFVCCCPDGIWPTADSRWLNGIDMTERWAVYLLLSSNGLESSPALVPVCPCNANSKHRVRDLVGPPSHLTASLKTAENH